MENLRIVICDANQSELEVYAKMCRAICKEQHIPATLTTFSSSQSLLFEMSDKAFSAIVSILILEPVNGEAVANTVRKNGYDGIILYLSRSTDKKHFYQAFDANVFNFVEKGDQERFARVFADTLKAALQLEHHYIVVSCAGEYRQIDLRDIYYFETTMDHMICVWYTGGKFVFQSSLSKLEKRLKDRGFIRVHRSYLVALAAIHRISFKEVTLNNGKLVPIGRGNYSALKDALDKWQHI